MLNTSIRFKYYFSGDLAKVGVSRNAFEFSELRYLDGTEVEAVATYKDEV
jgi:hypothetical protein